MLLIGGRDMSSAAISVKISETLNSGAARLIAVFPREAAGADMTGAGVTFSQNGVCMFSGRVFETAETERTVSVTAFDRLRYLTGENALARGAQTLDSFIRAAVMLSLGEARCGELQCNTARLTARCFQNVSPLSMIYSSMAELRELTGELLILRDEGGLLCLRNILSLDTGLLLGQDSLMTEYSRRAAVDDGACNCVTVLSDGAQPVAAAFAQDNAAAEKWGRIAIRRTVTGRNAEQAAYLAKRLLEQHCRESESISVRARGYEAVRCGSLVTLKLLGQDARRMCVRGCVHEFSGGEHRMSLELTMESHCGSLLS